MQIQPLPSQEDPFERPRPDNPPPVSAVGDDFPEYEIERLLRKRISRRRLQYLVKWKGYSRYCNRWYDVDDLQKASRLITEYEERNANRQERRRRRHTIQPPSEPVEGLPKPSAQRKRWKAVQPETTPNPARHRGRPRKLQ